ncbi:MAG: hypothetical protein ACOC8D_02585 [bacterium]
MMIERGSRCIVMICWLAAAAAAGEAWPQRRVVAVTGVGRCYDYSHSLGLWSVLPREGRPGRLLVGDGDLLLVAKEPGHDRDGDEPLVFCPYRQADGAELDFAVDGQRLTLGGQTVAARLAAEEGAWDWLKAAPAEERAALRCIYLAGKLDDGQMAALKALAAQRPALDLVVEKEAPLDDLLRLFEPRRLILPERRLTEAQQRLLAKLPELEALWVGAERTAELDFLTRLPRLRRLVVNGWKPGRADLFPWGCRRLRALGLTDCGLTSLTAIEHLTDLRELRLLHCKQMTDLTALTSVQRLSVLALFLDEQVEDYGVVPRLPKLRHLALGSPIAQPSFDALVRSMPDLQSLELVGCKEVNSLAAVPQLTNLDHLVLLTEAEDLEPVLEMKHLELLALPEKVWKDQQTIAGVRAALPQTALTEAQVCLGSGWLLVLVPAIALGWLLWWRRRGARERHA